MANSHDLTGSDIRGNIRRLAVPASVGFFCYTLYNMTDTFYAGYISTEAQSALTFSFPLYFLLLSFCVGIGQALTARLANAVGKKRNARAAYFFAQGVILTIAVCLLIWLLLLPFTEHIVTLLGSSGEAHQWATAYSRIIYIGAPLFLSTFILNGALQAVGNTTALRNSIIASVLLNIVLDPILMFGWFGLPALEITGVAVATLLAQGASSVYLLMVFLKTVIAKRWRWVFMYPRRMILQQLSHQAVTPTGRMLGIGFFFFLVTAFLGRISDDAVAAYGIALRIEQMFLLPTIGLEVALLAYAGQNLAAGNKRQTYSAYRLCMRYGLICMLSGALVLITLGRYFIALFNDDSEVIRHGYYYLLVAAAVGPAYLITNLGSAVLMGGLRTLDIAIVSVMRLLVLPLIFFWLLGIQLNLGVIGIWLGIFLANVPAAWWIRRRCLQTLAVQDFTPANKNAMR